MGSVHKFKRRPPNRAQFRGRKKPATLIDWMKPSRRGWFRRSELKLAGICLAVGAAIGLGWLLWPTQPENVTDLVCSSPTILDGDTFDCGTERVRLHGIDAPELEGHCRPGRQCTPGDPYASTANLERLAGGTEVQCRKIDTDVYGRTVARCNASGVDLSCAQIEGGFAVRRYGSIWCGF